MQRPQAIPSWLLNVRARLQQNGYHFSRPESCGNIDRVIALDFFIDVLACCNEDCGPSATSLAFTASVSFPPASVEAVMVAKASMRMLATTKSA